MVTDDRSDMTRWIRSALDRHERPLVRYATRITGDVEQARDVVQETFLRLCRADRATLDGHLAPWLYTVCRNRALDVQRHNGRMRPLPDASVETTPDTTTARSPDQARAPREPDEVSGLLRALDALPKRQQEVIRLKFQAGLSYRDIGDVVGSSAGNVGVLIHTGLKALRTRLQAAEPRPTSR